MKSLFYSFFAQLLLIAPIYGVGEGIHRYDAGEGHTIVLEVDGNTLPYYSGVNRRSFKASTSWRYELVNEDKLVLAQAHATSYFYGGGMTLELDKLEVLRPKDYGKKYGSRIMQRLLDDVVNDLSVTDVVLLASPLFPDNHFLMKMDNDFLLYTERAKLLPRLQKFYESFGGVAGKCFYDYCVEKPVMVQNPTSVVIDFYRELRRRRGQV